MQPLSVKHIVVAPVTIENPPKYTGVDINVVVVVNVVDVIAPSIGPIIVTSL
jgi:hypothetical protein